MKRLGQRGDTIVEVLIAVTVIGLVLATAYITTNRNYASMQDAQERTDALKILQQQAESLKTFANAGTGNAATLFGKSNFCVVLIGSNFSFPTNNSSTAPTNQCLVGSDGSQLTASTANQQPQFSIKINSQHVNGNGADDSGRLFTVTASWDNITGTGKDSASLQYGVYQ